MRIETHDDVSLATSCKILSACTAVVRSSCVGALSQQGRLEPGEYSRLGSYALVAHDSENDSGNTNAAVKWVLVGAGLRI